MAAIQPMSWRSVENHAAFSTGTFRLSVDKVKAAIHPTPPNRPLSLRERAGVRDDPLRR